jgi:hypothetical protein
MVRRIYEEKEMSPKQQCNKILSKLRKYAKDNDHFMTIEKFSMYDTNGDVYIYFTTHRYFPNEAVKFTFSLEYGRSERSNWSTYFSVRVLPESEAPETETETFDSYEEAYDFILNYIIEYGNIDN